MPATHPRSAPTDVGPGLSCAPPGGRRARRTAVLALLALAAAAFPLFAQTEPAPVPTPSPLDLRPAGSAAPQASPLAGALPPTLGLHGALPASGKVIAEVAVRGGKTVTPETVAFYLGVKPGDPYDAARLRRAFPKLWESGLFDEL